MDGKPLKGAQVVFQPKLEARQEGGPSQAETDEDGFFTLQYTFKKEGALVGPHVVSIRTGKTDYDDDDNAIKVAETVPSRYNAEAADNPEMNVEVESSGSTFEFKLTSSGEIIEEDEDGEQIEDDGCS